MADPVKPPLTRETLVRIAREQGCFAVNETEVDALLELANGLQAEADNAAKLARADVEPATEYRLEAWSHD